MYFDILNNKSDIAPFQAKKLDDLKKRYCISK